MRNHEDLEVWQKAHALTLALYRLTQRSSRPPTDCSFIAGEKRVAKSEQRS